ncbi:hypothetical protein PGTUg99_020307 [Puccinia graminis f. sp. tritici]|uniref:Uncharacterized protein n=1 Tax=Puccinia graminis f. sp. tritici TaxID=56615 RepID=A0A5B0SLG9_PUCGR|nr:hypothetical protein PGTUg99_020307 [Puccinia graminis f. sp. tritici]
MCAPDEAIHKDLWLTSMTGEEDIDRAATVLKFSKGLLRETKSSEEEVTFSKEPMITKERVVSRRISRCHRRAEGGALKSRQARLAEHLVHSLTNGSDDEAGEFEE